MRLSLSDHSRVPTSVSRLLGHSFIAAVSSATLLIVLAGTLSQPLASVLYVVAAPGLAVLLAGHYYWGSEAEEPLIAAIGFTAVAAVVDFALARLPHGTLELMDPSFGFGLALLLVFGATGLTGEMALTLGRKRSR